MWGRERQTGQARQSRACRWCPCGSLTTQERCATGRAGPASASPSLVQWGPGTQEGEGGAFPGRRGPQTASVPGAARKAPGSPPPALLPGSLSQQRKQRHETAKGSAPLSSTHLEKDWGQRPSTWVPQTGEHWSSPPSRREGRRAPAPFKSPTSAGPAAQLPCSFYKNLNCGCEDASRGHRVRPRGPSRGSPAPTARQTPQPDQKRLRPPDPRPFSVPANLPTQTSGKM